VCVFLSPLIERTAPKRKRDREGHLITCERAGLLLREASEQNRPERENLFYRVYRLTSARISLAPVTSYADKEGIQPHPPDSELNFECADPVELWEPRRLALVHGG
jgi:hypothetical protein